MFFGEGFRLKRENKFKAKTPTRKGQKRGIVTRSLWLEILFLLAMAVFGFSIVAHWLGSSEGTIINFALNRPQETVEDEEPDAVIVSLLYEAPSLRPVAEPSLSPVFMPSVQYWKEDLLRWGQEYSVDPNLIATLMQIESCGNDTVESYAGAMGLFQVMPFHFADDELPLDPDTNAMRGINYLTDGLSLAGGHAGLAMAGYNGGHGVIDRDYTLWPTETQHYYRWGSGIYREASAGWDSSPTLLAWLAAGGQSLCDGAEASLGLSTGT
jgi:hypothetical protein